MPFIKTLVSDKDHLKVLQEEDFKDVVELYKFLNPKDPLIYDNDISRNIWKDIINHPSLVMLGHLEDGRVVSCCTLAMVPNLSRAMKPYALIENVITLPEHRRKGYASKTIKEALCIAWKNNCYKVMILTGSKRESTLQFYEKCGFIQGKKISFIAYLAN